MKILFMDVDGVLNYEGCDSYYGSIYFVDEEKVRLLAEIIEETGAKIVLISTWRQGYFDLLEGKESYEVDLYEALVEILEEHDMKAEEFVQYADRHIQTDIKTGLEAQHVEWAIQILAE